MAKSIVTVSRLWNNPKILVQVTNEGIALTLMLDEFLNAMAAEMGNPTFLVTKAQLLAKMQAAASVVESGVKESSSAAV